MKADGRSMGIVLAIIVFSFIVIFHELGHFTLAKLNGIQVDEFCLGLGPTIFGKEIKGTKFSLKLLPFGGACMMGEDDAENLAEGSFNSKSVWARISVIAAGPVFNFILAFIMAVILVGFVGYDKPVLSGVTEGYAAEKAGMQEGDELLKINNSRIHLWREVSIYNAMHQGESAEITYRRDGETYTVTLTPKQDEDTGYYYYGVKGPTAQTKANAITAVQYGWYNLEYMVKYTIQCLKMMVRGQVGIKDMSGPVGVVDMMDTTYKESSSMGAGVVALNFLSIAILLSANLGVMNLLPIPALDGGRLVFLLIEAVRRKRVPPEKEGMVHFAGLVALMVLMVVIMYNDILKLL